MGDLGEEEEALARVDAGGHAQLNVLGRDRLDRPLHVRSGSGGTTGVAVAAEEEEQRVAAELEHVSAVALSDLDQGVEAARDSLDELLRACLALDPDPLRERPAAGEVDRDEPCL